MTTMTSSRFSLLAPTSKTEYILLLDEAIRLADEVNKQIDAISDFLAAKSQLPLAA